MPGQEIITTKPMLKDDTHPHVNEYTCLEYALSAVPNHEHYDAIVRSHSKKMEIPVLNWDPNSTVMQEGDKKEYHLNSCSFTDVDVTVSDSELASIDLPGLIDGLASPELVQTVDNERQEESKKTKKRIAHPEKWKANVKKTNRALGLAYESHNGSTVKAKSMREISDCQMMCSENFDEMERRQIFDEYWSKGNRKRQQDYICAMVDEEEPKTQLRQSSKKQRNVVRQYHF